MPKLVHPDSSLTIEPRPEHADTYLAAGWQPKPPSKPRDSGKPAKGDSK